MYDTLPKEVAFEDMKPGDLIFYSGTKQEGNEPWPLQCRMHAIAHRACLGGRHLHPQEREATEAQHGACGNFRGRRDGGGVPWSSVAKGQVQDLRLVQVYQQELPLYPVLLSVRPRSQGQGCTLVLIHPCLCHGLPRSLDTWLEGVCKSFCDEHPWEVKGFQDVDSAKSVFFQESADGGNCDSDGESDDGGDECKSGASDCAYAAPDAPCDASDGVEADAPAVPALNDPESNGASVANPPAS